ncbi:sodium/mannose cotransporter SLC5A10-like [Lineus longissimus]|uniref:sodium/mannose cotransporter SLC5A10-like n=1 Tax=Lineus longissimus TaxID=88925 RepID=UPI002B4E7744
MEQKGLDHWADILVLVIYFAVVLAVGLWSLCRKNRGSLKGYFLAGRNIPWWPVGASLFSSNIGSEHFIGLAGTGAASGIAVVLYEWASLPLLIILSWLFLPVYVTSGVYTLPEYLGKRFGGQRLRIYLSVLALVLYIITKLAVCIYAGALFIQLALGWDMYLSIVVLLIITGIFTVLGGLAAVIYTDTLQTLIMVIGAVILTILGYIEIGGEDNLKRRYMEAVPSIRSNNTTCGLPRHDAFNLFRHPGDPDTPWIGMILQPTIGCLWYWCADQVMVQRVLAAKDISHAKGGAILAGYLKLLPLWLIIMPGMISRALYPDEIGCVDPDECMRFCGNAVGCSNIAYPKLVMELMPVALKGLLLAVMLAAIMSSLSSIFNSASSVFTMDLWRRFRKQAQERELLIVGRIFIVILCMVSILWIPLVQSAHGGQLFVYIQAVQGYLGTPIGALFMMAILWKRMNETGAFWGIVAGHTGGVIRMVLDFVYTAPACGEVDTRPFVVYAVHYSYFGTILFCLTLGVGAIGSLVTQPQEETTLAGVTWWTKMVDPSTGKRVPEDKLEMAVRSDESTTSEDDGHVVENGHIPPDDKESELASGDSEEETGFCKKWLNTILGIKDKDHAVTTETFQNRVAFLHQRTRWRRLVNVNAAIALGVLIFLVGFYH